MDEKGDRAFWRVLDRLVETSEIVLDRPKGTAHPRYPDDYYPLDYGYLRETRSGDGDGIDIWVGSLPEKKVVAVVITVDPVKRDSEIKVLSGCTEAEMEMVLNVHQRYAASGGQAAILMKRIVA